MVGGIDQQAIVAERLENRRGLRRRLGRQFGDRLLGLRKFVVEKLRQRVVERVGAGDGRKREQGQNAERAQPKAAREIMSGATTGVRRRHDSPFKRSARFRSVLIGGGAAPGEAALDHREEGDLAPLPRNAPNERAYAGDGKKVEGFQRRLSRRTCRS